MDIQQEESITQDETEVSADALSSPGSGIQPPQEPESMIEVAESINWMEDIEFSEDEDRVALIDAMAVVQGIKKTPTMKKMLDFRDVLIKKVQRKAKGYTETRVLFDEYQENSLKEHTRAKRADAKNKKKSQPIEITYRINENMSLAAISLKDLLTSMKTKRNLTVFLAEKSSRFP